MIHYAVDKKKNKKKKRYGYNNTRYSYVYSDPRRIDLIKISLYYPYEIIRSDRKLVFYKNDNQDGENKRILS